MPRTPHPWPATPRGSGRRHRHTEPEHEVDEVAEIVVQGHPEVRTGAYASAPHGNGGPEPV